MGKQELLQCATREDVAKRAGVSVTVVSYVMNDNRYVDKEKRARVLQAAKELHYTPNNIARALKGKSSKHIILIVDNTTNERFGRLISQLDKYAYEKGSMVSLCASRNDPEFVRQVIARRFDGIVISSISFSEKYISEFAAAGIPVVLLQNRQYSEIKGVAEINTGLYQGAQECIHYFYDQGRRNILYLDRISKRNHFSDLSDNRYRGFVHAMKECGLESEGHFITNCVSEEELQGKLIEAINNQPIDAILGRNDSIACIAMKTILRSGRRIPEDISVIGWDDSSICRMVTPSLSSMRLQEEDIAKTAVDMLYEMQMNLTVSEPRRFASQLIVRHSTDSRVADE